MRPVRISRPPMMIGISIFSPAIFSSRAFRSARSGEPGAYVRLGSLTGWGTRRTPANAALRTTPLPVEGLDVFGAFGAVVTVVVIVGASCIKESSILLSCRISDRHARPDHRIDHTPPLEDHELHARDDGLPDA